MRRRTRLGRRAALVVVAALAGCTTTSVRPDVAAINDLLRDRPGAPGAVAVPEGDAFGAADAEVARLLAAPLTAEAAVRVALLENRALRAALAELGIPRGALVSATSLPNPEVEIGMARPLEGDGHGHLEVGIGFDLSRILLRGQRAGVAEAELDAARQQVAAEVLDTGHRARDAFHDVQAALRRHEIAVQALRNFQAAWDTAEELHRAGNVTDLVLAEQRAAVEGARLLAADAETELLAARERLNVLLNLHGPQAVSWKVAGFLEDPPAEASPPADVERRALESNLELAALKARLEAAAGRVDLASTEAWLSHLEVGAHAENEDDVWEVGGHVGVTLPVFDRGQGAEGAARAAVLGLRNRYVQTAVEVRAAARLAAARLEAARLRAIRVRDGLLPAQRSALEHTIREYNAMQIGVFDLLNVHRQSLDAALAYVDALRDYWRARSTLDLVLAGRHAGLDAMPRAATPFAAPASHQAH